VYQRGRLDLQRLRYWSSGSHGRERVNEPAVNARRERSHGKMDAMGRKSSAKGPTRPTAPGEPPTTPSRRSKATWIATAVAALAIVGALAFTRGNDTAPGPAQTAEQTAVPAVVDPPASALLGPHPQANLPPLPFDAGPPARPAEVVRAVYKFAAEHPEVLSYVPCYCGCEHQGHRGNEDCFVTRRNAAGDVTEWEPHGMT
jgi:hypothetical protein